MKRLLLFLITMAVVVSAAACAVENPDEKTMIKDTTAETKAEYNFVYDDLKDAQTSTATNIVSGHQHGRIKIFTHLSHMVK